MLNILALLSVLFPLFEDPNTEFLCDNNFTQVLLPLRDAFVFIKSKKCPHCAEFYPNFEVLARQNPHKTKFYIVDFESCPRTVYHFNVSGFPTLVFPRYLNRYSFCNTRDINGPLQACMNEKYFPAGQIIHSYTELVDVISKNQSFFLSNHQLSDAEKREADEFTPEIKFYSLNSWEFMQKALPQYKPQANLIYYRAEDRQFLDVNNKIDRKVISDFLAQNKNPAYIKYTPENVNDVFTTGKKVVMIKFDKSYDAFNNSDLRILEEAGNSGEKVVYFTSQTSAVFNDVIQPPEDAPSPVIAIIELTMDADPPKWVRLTEQSPKDFIKDVLTNKLKSYVKSEEIPSDNDGPIKRIVGLNYKDEVENAKKPFVLLIYKSENYATSVLQDKLVDVEAEIGNAALFGMVDISKNTIPLIAPENPPIVAIVNRGKVSYYTRSEKANLVQWIQANINNNEL